MAKTKGKLGHRKGPRATGVAKTPEEIGKIRNQVKNVILNGSVEMTERIVRSVNEKASVNALKFLWERAGLFPSEAAEQDSAEGDSLAAILLKALQAPTGDDEDNEDEGNEEGDVKSKDGEEGRSSGERTIEAQ